MRRMLKRQVPVGVIHICWMAPGPPMSARTRVSPAAIVIDGDILHPRPSSRAGAAPVPSVAAPPRPFSPVKFSGLIERVLAFDKRDRVAMSTPKPFQAMGASALILTGRREVREIFLFTRAP